MFTDMAQIYIRSGKGGDGHVSFRREIYVPNGGPDGGDGGKGGDLIFEVDLGMNTLNHFRYVKKYCAENGENGGKKRCSGKNGADLVIKVPEGTIIRETESGKVIADLSHENKRETILKGGRGGKGNMNYATATMQAPKYAQPGQEYKELNVTLELKVIADVGLVGYPNVGKSTLLSRATNAKPKIANYHFTTLNPNLGVVELKGTSGYVIADIPGLIEGAAKGVGLGHEFLKHIERTKLIIHVVDSASIEGRDPILDIQKINEELTSYSLDLQQKPQVIAANKIDLIYEEEREEKIKQLKEYFEPQGIPVFPVSGVNGDGLKELLYHVDQMLRKMDDTPIVFEREYFEQKEKEQLPFMVSYDAEDHVYVIEGPRVERMLGYTNLESEKGFEFFQKFLKENGMLDQLEELGIKDDDTVRIYGWEFSYYK